MPNLQVPLLGIDFGTSNSAAAVRMPDGVVHTVQLDGTRAEMPSAVFFPAEPGPTLFGSAAMQAYLSGTEGRLLRALKSLLGSPLMDEFTAINGQALRFFDIVVLFLKEVKRRSEAQIDQPLACAVLGRPVHFVDDHPQRDTLAQTTLERAAREAGFSHIGFQLEPIAAALDYAQRVNHATTALVVDIGGGTSDFTVIRLPPAQAQQPSPAQDILATSGIHIGGTDFDRMLDLSTVMPLLGYGHQGKGGRPVPSSVYFDLSTWHLIHQSYSRKSMHFARELWTDFADPLPHQRLMDALENQHGHRMLSAVEAAKIECSIHAAEAPLALDFLRGVAAPTITPQHLAQTLHPLLERVVQCAHQCVERSGASEVEVIYLTGGSSALRPLVDALQRAMPRATLVAGNRFGGVAAGLALAAMPGA